MTQLTQMELFDRTLEMKILSMEKWVGRIQKQLWFLKNVHDLRNQQRNTLHIDSPKEEQMDMF